MSVVQVAALALVSALAPLQKDPRTSPLLPEDALFTIPDVSGRMELVGDLDGDGFPDLVVERGTRKEGKWGPYLGSTDRLDAVSGRDGRTIRTLWRYAEWQADRLPRLDRRCTVWDAGADLDGDGTSDVTIGAPADSAEREQSGALFAISGSDGELLWRLSGSAAFEGLGRSVVLVGDQDGDGVADVAVGAHQQGGAGSEPGFVSIRSGRDGRELRRIVGSRAGQGFGSQIARVGDVDGDGREEIVVACDAVSDEPVLLIPTGDGSPRRFTEPRHGAVCAVGDVDGDAAGDVALTLAGLDYDKTHGHALVISARSARQLHDLRFPDNWSSWSFVFPLGDLDGDGCAEIGLGEGNYNRRTFWDALLAGWWPFGRNLRAMTLPEALALPTEPRVMGVESGVAHVVSGRTGEVIEAVFGVPGTHGGLGLAMAPLGDVTGDGYPDLVVADSQRAYAFPGPGPARKEGR